MVIFTELARYTNLHVTLLSGITSSWNYKLFCANMNMCHKTPHKLEQNNLGVNKSSYSKSNFKTFYDKAK